MEIQKIENKPEEITDAFCECHILPTGEVIVDGVLIDSFDNMIKYLYVKKYV